MSELGDAPVDRSCQHRAVTNVSDRGDRALPFLLDEPRGLVKILRPGQRVLVGLDVCAQVHRDDVGALCGKHSRVRPPLTARGSADHSDFARYSAHRRSFRTLSNERPALRPRAIRDKTRIADELLATMSARRPMPPTKPRRYE